MNRCETATWGTLWPGAPPLGALFGGLVGQGLWPSSKLSHVGFPGEQEEALGLAPSSHMAPLHRDDETERKDTGPSGMCGAQRPQPGTGTLHTGTGPTQRRFKEERPGSLKLSGTRARQWGTCIPGFGPQPCHLPRGHHVTSRPGPQFCYLPTGDNTKFNRF